MKYRIDTSGITPSFVFYETVLLFFLLAMAAAVLLSVLLNHINKKKYAFEDYHQNITDNLSNELKASLTEISENAEDAIKALKNGKTIESVEYIEAILKKASDTEANIKETLTPENENTTDTKAFTDVSLDKLANELIHKFDRFLISKNISFEINGAVTVKAENDSLSSAIENMISNAVFYANDKGSIKIQIKKHSFTVMCTTLKKIDTKDLTDPLKKAEKETNSSDNCRTGYHTVKEAAEANKMKLFLSSEDHGFIAKLVF